MILAGRRILLVHGLMGEVMAALRPIGIDYMQGLAAWLREAGAEVDVVRLPTGEPVIGKDPYALSLNVAAPGEVPGALVRVREHGVDISEFSLGQPSLDEVFLALTGEHVTDAEADTASHDREVPA